MTSKSAECYNAVFDFIEQNAFNLEPCTIITDFEGGLSVAINQTYPQATLSRCWFHYSCAISRRLKREGLNPIIKINPDARLIKNALLSLPLLPAANFIDGYDFIKKTSRERKLSMEFGSFFEYFDSYWLQEVFFLLLFYLRHIEEIFYLEFIQFKNEANSLSVFGRNMRTTSSLESMNFQMNRLFFKRHPNIFFFMEHLKSHEYTEAEEMFNLINTVPKDYQCERRRARDKKRDRIIKYYSGLLKQNAITVNEFLEATSEARIFIQKGMQKLFLSEIPSIILL